VACDAAAYYFHPPDLYGNVPGDGVPAYLYSPVFSFLIEPLRLLSFEGFVTVWFGLHVAALLWLRAGFLLAVPGINEDVIRGNVGTFVAVAIVLGIRYGAAWAPVLLTKVPSGIGIVWHLARLDWRQLAWGVSLTAGLAGVSIMVAPHLWSGWISALLHASSTYGGEGTTVGLLVRIPLALLLIVYAARTDRAWLVPFGVILGSAGISPPSFIKLAAVPRLASHPT